MSEKFTPENGSLYFWPLIFQGKDVRTAIDERDKTLWVHAGDLGDILGLSNIHANLSSIKSIWKRSINTIDSVGRTHPQTFLSEQAVYKLTFSSRKPEAEAFTDKVAELLQKLRTGKLVLRPRSQALIEHTSERLQKDNSISFNRKIYLEGGRQELIRQNGLLCQYVSDKHLPPKQLKIWAKEVGLHAKDRSTGQQVLRRTEPHSAAACSLAKNVMEMGMPWGEAIQTAKESKSIYARILKYGTPSELLLPDDPEEEIVI